MHGGGPFDKFDKLTASKLRVNKNAGNSALSSERYRELIPIPCNGRSA
jgi:hypothetical protein